MRLNLKRHETSAAEAVREVSVEIDWLGPDRLVLTYELVGDLSQILVPVAVPPARTDNLWHHTCLEAFIRAEGAENYIEFNLSPSTAWVAYRFDAYRQGMADLDVPAPTVMTELWPDRLRLTAYLSLAGAPLDLSAVLRLSATAIVEEADGAKAFWALTHPPGQPEFHHVDGFSHRIPPSDRP